MSILKLKPELTFIKKETQARSHAYKKIEFSKKLKKTIHN